MILLKKFVLIILLNNNSFSWSKSLYNLLYLIVSKFKDDFIWEHLYFIEFLSFLIIKSNSKISIFYVLFNLNRI